MTRQKIERNMNLLISYLQMATQQSNVFFLVRMSGLFCFSKLATFVSGSNILPYIHYKCYSSFVFLEQMFGSH